VTPQKYLKKFFSPKNNKFGEKDPPMNIMSLQTQKKWGVHPCGNQSVMSHWSVKLFWLLI
jgi:hypothetical protein